MRPSFERDDQGLIESELRRRAHAQTFLRFVQTSYPPYQAAWVHRELCTALERFQVEMMAGRQPRLMIFMPPRHGKSFLVSERFPVWLLGKQPDCQVLLASYAQRQAERFSRRARALAREPWMKSALPQLAVDPHFAAASEWGTRQGGAYRAVGVGGPLTGTGAHVLVIDDPVKNHQEAYSPLTRDKIWEWYGSVAETRLMPNSGVLLVMTRWHRDDLAGRLLAAGSDRWTVLSYPAIATRDEPHRRCGEALDPDRFPLARLEGLRKRGGWIFEALYQQAPVAEIGEVFRRDWWQTWDVLPADFDEQWQSWDMSFKGNAGSDFVVGQVWARRGADFYLLDQVRGRLDFPATLVAIRALSRQYPETHRKLVEDTANGPAILSVLRRELPGLIPVTPQGGKLARAASVQPVVQSGNVYLPSGARASWVGAFLDEAAAFPRGPHDDQVDAMTQALQDGLRRLQGIHIGLA